MLLEESSRFTAELEFCCVLIMEIEHVGNCISLSQTGNNTHPVLIMMLYCVRNLYSLCSYLNLYRAVHELLEVTFLIHVFLLQVLVNLSAFSYVRLI